MYEKPVIRELNMQTCSESSCQKNGCMQQYRGKTLSTESLVHKFKLNQ